ncbi:CASP-like protein 1D1 [Cinnamomum micranthum f. kanehirae]|uniref:CASP-like protein n=1 Tax=Cinnamomum micranthum f. kanehirae TaxID=337451 RepID=A0A3S3NWJ1_9MAGN|nr:CASP-like protein 1D1 [Cinnamomum micranthum f. kanehirae]
MASTDKPAAHSDKTEVESQPPNHSPCINLFLVDLPLRVLLFASTVVAIVLITTSKDTEIAVVSLAPSKFGPRAAKFTHSPALIYFLVAVSVACLYSILSIFASFSSISKPAPPKTLLLVLAFFDALFVGIVSSALGAAAGVAYIGYKGNSHVGWNKICNVYDKFCRHIAGYLTMALLASIILVFLTMLSTYSLYRRSR